MSRPSRFLFQLTVLIFLSFLVSQVNAATFVIGSSDSGSRYPFGLDPGSASSSFPDFSAGGTYQQVYAGSAFSGPIIIRQIAFASSAQFTSSPGTAVYNFKVSLSTTAAGPNGLSTNLAANRGADFAQVFSGPVTASITDNDQFDLIIDIVPFTYDPANGNLLCDIELNAATQFTGSPVLFVAGFSPSTSRVANPTGAAGSAFTDGFGLLTRFTPSAPTAAAAMISAQVKDQNGIALAGVALHLSGATSATAITDGSGTGRFEGVDAADFYTITPELANYHFAPASRSFSLAGNETEAMFTAVRDTDPSANAIDTNEYFVRQHYLDFLDREPDPQGLANWLGRLNQCQADTDCLRERRIDVSAAFFKSVEFRQTGSYVYRVYRGVLGRVANYAEFAADRRRVVGGPNLDQDKLAFAVEFADRPEFVRRYQANLSAESFVDALLKTLRDSSGVDLSSERAELITRYNLGGSLTERRGRVVADLADNDRFNSAVLNEAFVQMEYFGYLRRDVDGDGYAFWLHVLNEGDAGNYRGMVCSFITSAEYQQRFGTLVTSSNVQCGR